MSKIVAVVSGGIDSVTMAHHLAAEGHTLQVMAVDYGQRHRKELEFAAAAADRLGALYEEVDLRSLRSVMRGSSLTDPSVAVPRPDRPVGGNPNIVPNRNAVLLSVAFALAVTVQADAVAFGVMAEDVGPSDTSPEFLRLFLEVERVATRGSLAPEVELLAPLIALPKTGVVALGEKLGVPWDQTWTCFRGEDIHCGACAACAERRGAFADLGITDPTVYREAWTPR
ncbi:7-cyano-7-deazaguanine synthase [Streptomyces sp. TS71-3]|uniref:7-cyano-7-deazaguanine synthase n=1 Tax=Streptomyces sp. TS71-3 TaxID=2733862 RepID=UPI001B167AB1|nr:7-cyano-7-deazaguanine synthase [Streptomyces sp. TS71-3]GHJ40801.1 7-cyano-7-deazaguanine synthase [Streptomyces sp. TS71-3]